MSNWKKFAKKVGKEYSAPKRNYKLLASYALIGKFYPRCISPWSHISSVLEVGEEEQSRIDRKQRREQGENVQEPERGPQVEENFSPEQKANLHHEYSLLFSKFPFLHDFFDACAKNNDSKMYDVVLQLITAIKGEVRATDTNRCKKGVSVWIPRFLNITYRAHPGFQNCVPVTLYPVLNSARDKSDRGVRHPQIRLLLCPWRYIKTAIITNDDYPPEERRAHDQALRHLKDGRISQISSDLPAFLYHLPDYDASDMWAGLFRSDMLLCGFRAIFTGPDSATEQKTTKSRSGNAEILKVTEVTPEMIAYVAVQVRFALGTAQEWCQLEGQFDYVDFYYNLRNIIGEGPKKWRRELFENVFPFKHTGAILGPPHPAPMSDIERLLAQTTENYDEPEPEPDATATATQPPRRSGACQPLASIDRNTQ
ncbi:hypothetical protein F5880DRAFT_1610642 [Lentinula raphanica]|nr:hypothetical protein F5880DRAFT_1610642 [Lentinula raphanica]